MTGRSSKNFVQGVLIGGGIVFFLAGLIVVGALNGGIFGASPGNGGAPGTTSATQPTTETTTQTPTMQSTASPTPTSTPEATSTSKPTSTASPTTTTTATTTTQPRTEALYRVNVGGPRIPSRDGGPAWQADTENNPSRFGNARISGSQTNNTNDRITLTPDVPQGTPRKVFKSWRWDADFQTTSDDPEMQWRFPVEGGTYKVRLYFAETYLTDSGPNSNRKEGPRTFDVRIERRTVLNDYEMYAELGHDRGTTKSFTVNVRDGVLGMTFLHEQEDPQLQGIEVVRVSDSEQNGRERPPDRSDGEGDESDGGDFDVRAAPGQQIRATTAR